MRFVLTVVNRFWPKVSRSLPSNSIRIGVDENWVEVNVEEAPLSFSVFSVGYRILWRLAPVANSTRKRMVKGADATSARN
jgi:hypothetical protein